MSNNLISVILPVYNGEQTIRDAVQSILAQEDCLFELLVIDNSSTDDTNAILKELADSDSRIRLLYEPIQGISFALNHGLSEAKGKYVARMDADDISLPERLQKQSLFLDKNPDIGLVSGLVKYGGNVHDPAGFSAYVSQLNLWKTEAQIYKYRFVESPLAHPSVMFRKSLIDQYGPYSLANEPEDYELWLRWFSIGVRMAKLDQFVIQWIDSPNRLSRINERCSAEAIDKVRYRYLSKWLIEYKPRLKPMYVWGGGKLANKKMRLIENATQIPITGIIDLKDKGGDIPHIHFSNLPPQGEIFVLSLVSNRGKYLEIENYLETNGYSFEIDYILAQ